MLYKEWKSTAEGDLSSTSDGMKVEGDLDPLPLTKA